MRKKRRGDKGKELDEGDEEEVEEVKKAARRHIINRGRDHHLSVF